MESRETVHQEVATVSYDAGFIVLSYVISLIGCITTLELLHRRTSLRGFYNWFLLLASCITMGGIGIWCMHFIGNRAVVLANGASHRQIVYSSGFTAVSFFLPILVLLLAFYLLGVNNRAHSVYIVLAGFLTGTAVCAMHYVGQLGISNYVCTYRVQNIVGAAVIAVIASIVALSVFFRLREKWTDSWYKRALCGAVLASAVSGMHWTAAVGTIYEFRDDQFRDSGLTRTQTVIVCAVLATAACVILLAIMLVRSRKEHIMRTRAKQLVLACAYFDEEGRIMVTSEGALPCYKITDHFVERTFGEDELSRLHPTFAWIFRASRNWSALKDLIPGMAAHLNSDPATRKYWPKNGPKTISDDSSDITLNFSVVFKQLFCVAAQQLANQIHEPLESLGALFEEPLETGTLHASGQARARGGLRKLFRTSPTADVEKDAASATVFGRGKYLFLNRRLNKSESARFAAMGYRFGPVQQVSETLARSMRVTHASMLIRLERMKASVSKEHRLPPGVRLAGFVIRPSVYKSFDILVPASMQSQLPSIPLIDDELNEWQTDLLARFDEWTIKDILQTLIKEAGCLDQERDFRWAMHSALIRIIDMVGDFDHMMSAKLSTKQIRVPCRVEPGKPSTCTLLTVRLMNTVHAQTPKKDMTYAPLSFFSAQQQVESATPNHEAFTRRLKMEFGYPSEPPTLRSGSIVESIILRSSRLSSRRPSATDMRGFASDTPRRPSTVQFPRSRRFTLSRQSEETSSSSVVIADEADEKDTTGDKDNNLETVLAEPSNTSLDVDVERASVLVEKGTEILPLSDENWSWVTDLFSLFRL